MSPPISENPCFPVPVFCGQRHNSPCCLVVSGENRGVMNGIFILERKMRKARAQGVGSWCVIDARLLWQLSASEALLCQKSGEAFGGNKESANQILIASSARRNMSMVRALCLAEARVHNDLNRPPISASICGLFCGLEALRIESRILSHPREAAALRALILASPRLLALEIELEDNIALRAAANKQNYYIAPEKQLGACDHMMLMLRNSLSEQSSLIRILSLCGCGLLQIPWPLVEVCPLLEKVSLRENRLTSVRQLCQAVAGLERLDVLDASGNALSTKCAQEPPPWLAIGSASELYLARNCLESLNGLEYCLGLETLDLGHNHIQYRDEIAVLGRLPLLSQVILAGNPVMEDEGMRHAALALLARRDADGSLIMPILDTKKSSRHERRQVAKIAFVPVRNLSYRSVSDNETTLSADNSSVSVDNESPIPVQKEDPSNASGLSKVSPLDEHCASNNGGVTSLHRKKVVIVTPDTDSKTIISESMTEPTITPIQSLATQEAQDLLLAHEPENAVSIVTNNKRVSLAPDPLPLQSDEAYLQRLFSPIVDRGAEKLQRILRCLVSIPQESETSLDIRGCAVGNFPRTRPSVLVVSNEKLYVYEGDERTLNADFNDPRTPAPRLLFAPQLLCDIENAIIGFKFLWIRFSFVESKEVIFPTRRRDATLAILDAVMPIAKRKRRVKILNDDSRTLDILTEMVLAPFGDNVPLLYAAADQFWRSKRDSIAPRILVITAKRLYLLADHLPFTYSRSSDSLILLETISWRRTRYVQLNDEPGLLCELTISFVDNSRLATISNFRTWRLRFPHSAHAHAAHDLIFPRLRGASPSKPPDSDNGHGTSDSFFTVENSASPHSAVDDDPSAEDDSKRSPPPLRSTTSLLGGLLVSKA
mmetsp:Transcript_21953/g.33861  ORF Transcript_21953/g.33861 Transcript_21953/m.33861 type:complete len:886 (-) Transcript_21953:37-2694(-)